MSKRPELPTETGSFDRLYRRLPVIKRRAAAVGVELVYDVQAEGSTGPERQKEMFAASLGKLALASALIKVPNILLDDKLVILDTDVREGGGAYDKEDVNLLDIVGEPVITVDQAMYDMLANSGETAYRLLSQRLAKSIGGDGDNAERLNELYRSLGYTRTNVIQRENGIEIGESSPVEVIKQLDAIHDAAQQEGSHSLAGTAWLALSMGQREGNGMRRFNLPKAIDLLSKTGEYNGDPLDKHVYRHEAGHLILPDDNVIKYCFMTRSRSMNPAYRYLNELVLATATNELAAYAGIPRVRLLGLRGLVGYPVSR